MLDIYLCEDDPEQLMRIRKAVENFLCMHPFRERLYHVSSSAEEFLTFFLAHRENIGLYFLDIAFSGKQTGMDLARQIRKQDPRGYIVFVTAQPEFTYLSFEYQIEALHFIPKTAWDTVKAQIFQCMKIADQRQTLLEAQNNHVIPFKDKDLIQNIPISTIFSVHTCNDPHRLIVSTADGIRNIYGSLKSWKTNLEPYGFAACSASALVNLKQISQIDLQQHKVFLSNSEMYPLSRRHQASFCKKAQMYT